MSWAIKVPASTSNLGAGFDSIGLALNLYLELTVTASDQWEFVPLSKSLEGIPTGKNNLVYEIASQVAEQFGYSEMPPCQVEMTSNIPLARGLGSSATAIIAGIELANEILQLNLDKEQKLEIATAIEGHPDNVAPSLMGGCVIGHYDTELNWLKLPVEGVTFVAIVPSFELKTTEARAVLPEQMEYKKSVHASSIANVSVAAICSQNWDLLGEMMKKDLFHQPYRKSLIPHYDELAAYLEGKVHGLFLSGAGPTMIAMVNPDRLYDKLEEWQQDYPQMEWLPLKVENEGAVSQKLNVMP
ncbi:homoserine kinase [Sediminibacillus massiliensis]|uniref:homoserine kinase n=1 Tax=Sediminibacillus massiliensis TaxID=1926277 RepID=UPI0009883FAF|nr:homoserine kinase [Sediminibacillus massiliensis]